MNERDYPITKQSSRQWALCNCGIVWSVHPTRTSAIAEAEKMLGEPWSRCKKYLQARKVRIVEGWDEGDAL